MNASEHSLICKLLDLDSAPAAQDKSKPGRKDPKDHGDDGPKKVKLDPFFPIELASTLGDRATFSLNCIDGILAERLFFPKAAQYFFECFCRVEKTDTPQGRLIRRTVVSYASLMLQSAVMSSRVPRGPRQLVDWLSNEQVPNKSVSVFLSAIVRRIHPATLPAVAKNIFEEVVTDMRLITLISENFLGPLRALALLLSVPVLTEKFVLMENFMNPWVNGFKIETESPLGTFFRLTVLPDEPSVGDHYFVRPLHMTPVERSYVMTRLNTKLESSHALLATCFQQMMQHPVAQPAVLTWLSTMLLGNWGRTRLQPRKGTTSNDGFLLNVTAVMTRWAAQQNLFRADTVPSVDPLYCILPSRLDVRDETRLCATAEEASLWALEWQSKRAGPNQAAATSMMLLSRHKSGTLSSFPSASSSPPSASSPTSPPLASTPTLPLTGTEFSLGPVPLSRNPSDLGISRMSLQSNHNDIPLQPPPNKKQKETPRVTDARFQSMDDEMMFDADDFKDTAVLSTHTGSELHEQSFIHGSTWPIHNGIVCDKCRMKNIQGVRYKCANCKDFDLCAACEAKDYAESLGLTEHSGVTFQCPYLDCPLGGLSEIGLRDHVSEKHVEPSLISCPICEANGTANALFIQPKFTQHLTKDHCDEHDKVRHTMLKLPRMTPHFHNKIFNRLPNFPLDPGAETLLTRHKLQSTSPSINSVGTSSLTSAGALFKPSKAPTVAAMIDGGPDGSVNRVSETKEKESKDDERRREIGLALCEALDEDCRRKQQAVVHTGVQCSHCRVMPIRGVCYTCYNCTDYNLCETCESLGFTTHHHDPTHVFLKFRRPFKLGEIRNISVCPNLYPTTMLGNWGFNIATEWLFMAIHSLHVGAIKTVQRYTMLVQSVDGETDDRKMERLVRIRLSVEAQLLHPRLLSDTLQLYVFIANRMISIIDPTARGLPLTEKPPMHFAGLPEYLIDDMSEFLVFLSRFSAETVDSINVLPIIHLFVYLLSSPKYLNNPYLRAKLVEVFCGSEISHGSAASIGKLLTQDAFATSHLIPALIRLYIDIEHTGSDSQFYDKFNVRHAVAVLIRSLTSGGASGEFTEGNRRHTKKLEEQTSNVDLFLRFTNCIINDMIYLLDEAIIKAKAMHALQQIQHSPSRLAALSIFARGEHERNITGTERSLRTASTLASHTITLLWTLSSNVTVQNVLIRPEMVERISQSMNDYVNKLAGSDREQISLVDGRKMNFLPDQWLDQFTDIYLSFRQYDVFLQAVVKDNRSFDPAAIRFAVNGRPKEKRDAVEKFIEAAEKTSSQLISESEELGDVPEEFLDPILNTIMSDPVKLPTSGVTIDRAVISRHLLNDSNDPFNRQPLTLQMLKPDVELKNKIEAYRRERSKAKASNLGKRAEGKQDT